MNGNLEGVALARVSLRVDRVYNAQKDPQFAKYVEKHM